MPSKVTQTLIDELTQRDSHGQRKYGTTLDRTDLTVCDWIQHGKEELLDGAGYLEALKLKMRYVDAQLEQLIEELREHGASQRAAVMIYNARRSLGVKK